MKHDIATCCANILQEITDIENFMQDCNTLADFQTNIMRKKAILHGLIIIGAASNRIRKINPNIAIQHIHSIVGLRNHLTHAYDTIDDTIVYAVVMKHLSALKQEIITLMAAHTP